MSSSKKGRQESRCVFVGNIPYDATDQQLQEFFSSVSGPDGVQIRIMYDRQRGTPKGYGFVEFKDAKLAQMAIRNLNGQNFRGRNLSVDVAEDDSVSKGRRGPVGGHKRTRPSEHRGMDRKPIDRDRDRGRFRSFVKEKTFTKTSDQITKIVTEMDEVEKGEILEELRELIRSNEPGARNLLMESPQLAQAILLINLQFDMCKIDELRNVCDVVDETRPNEDPPLAPPILIPVPAPYPTRPMAPPLAAPIPYPPMPVAPAMPVAVRQIPVLDPKQQSVLNDVLALTPAQIQAQPPEVQAKILSVKQQLAAGVVAPPL